MNERIKELVARDFPHDCNGDILTTPESIADFAELIVQESIEVMKRHDYHGEWLGEKIREHFGIEE